MASNSTSRHEIHRICNLVPSRDTDRDFTLESARASNALAEAPTALPPSVDLRAAWWKIGDQESTGSCVGWASTDGLARYHMVKAGKIDEPGLLSPRCTWMASKETDIFTTRPQTFIEGAGTSLKASVDILRKFGAVPEELVPFHITTTMYGGNEEAFYVTAATRRISAYFNLLKNFGDWRNWLANKGPLLVGLRVDATWDNATATHGLLDTFQPGTVRGGHAVCLVGYRPDGRFIIRNSWGAAWGDRGFAYASEAYIASGFFDESYGVTV